MFQLLSIIALKFGIYLYNVKKYAQQYIKNINKNIFNKFLIVESRRTRTHLFQKSPAPTLAPAPAPAPECQNAPVLHSCNIILLKNINITPYYLIIIILTFNSLLPETFSIGICFSSYRFMPNNVIIFINFIIQNKNKSSAFSSTLQLLSLVSDKGILHHYQYNILQ